MGDLVEEVTNMTINDIIYELITATASETQIEFSSDLEKIPYITNEITHQILLSSQTIRI